MRIKELDLTEILFTYTSYTDSLKASVERIGFSVPIKVKQVGDHYECVDGHKRLSALSDLLKEGHSKRTSKIKVIFVDNGDTRTNDMTRGRNFH